MKVANRKEIVLMLDGGLVLQRDLFTEKYFISDCKRNKLFAVRFETAMKLIPQLIKSSAFFSTEFYAKKGDIIL